MSLSFRIGCALVTALIAAPRSLAAQAVRNLDFEQRGIASPDRPLGWQTGGAGYSVTLDSTVTLSGHQSLRSRRVDETGQGYGAATQTIPIDLVLGKEVQLRGWIRTEAVEQGYAGFWMRVDGPVGGSGGSRPLALDNMANRGATGVTPWTLYEVTLWVDSAATAVLFGALHPGNGTAWFDALELRVGGVPLDSISPDGPVSPAELAWLRANLLPLESDDPGSGFRDLETLAPLVEGARIIGLGEGTHGTREFFRMKHRLVEWLTEREGVKLFAIEANMPEARRVNDYVLTGKGDAREALAGMYFWTWNTEEVLGLIEWMREYNASGRGPIQFWGIDMQVPRVAADSVRAFVERVDLAFLPEVDSAYDIAVHAWRTGQQPATRDPELERSWHSAAATILDCLESKRGEYLERADTTEVDWAIQNARIVMQGAEARRFGTLSRDQSMAENVGWILGREPAGTRIVLWAHNAHVYRAPGWMGAHLAEWYGEEYRPVGFAFGEGEYTAVGPRGLASYPASAPPLGAVEHTLRGLGAPLFALDLRSLSAAPAGAWLLEPHLFRSIGAVALDEPFFASPVARFYDGLIYIDHTSATRRLSALAGTSAR